jgi:hypothetical protein
MGNTAGGRFFFVFLFFFFFPFSSSLSFHHGSSDYSDIYIKFAAPKMKSKKGGKSNGKKGGGGKKKGGGGKKSPQQPPRADEKPGFVLPSSERGFAPGFGCMVTKAWAEAYANCHYPLMIEIARANMQRYGDQVTDVQSKASLMHMLGYSLTKTTEKEATKEGAKFEMEAFKLIRSMGERSTKDIVYGVWPESCYREWSTSSVQLDISEVQADTKWVVEVVNLTHWTIKSQLDIFADDPDSVEFLRFFSRKHYETELSAMHNLSRLLFSLSEEDYEKWLRIFGKRLKVIEAEFKREGWDLSRVQNAKGRHLDYKCRQYGRHGKVELALDLVREALDEEDPHSMSFHLHAELCLRTGRIEEAFESMEKALLVFRSGGMKAAAVDVFNELLGFVAEESRSLFGELVPKYPHVLWAASGAGFVKLSQEESKALRSHLVMKKGLYCVNCEKEMTKTYRCSRCNQATYCGSACQKEAWKEHKKICKKRE